MESAPNQDPERGQIPHSGFPPFAFAVHFGESVPLGATFALDFAFGVGTVAPTSE